MGFMDRIDIFKLIEEEHLYLAISILLIFIIIFGIPSEFETLADYAIFIFSVVFYLLFKEISKSLFLRDFFLKNILVEAEMTLRKKGIKNKYFDLPDKGKEEIKHIDIYSNKFISEYILSLLFIFISAIFVLFNYSGIVHFKPVTVEVFSIPSKVVIFFVLIMNLICFLNSKKEISEYIVNQNDIYMFYRG